MSKNNGANGTNPGVEKPKLIPLSELEKGRIADQIMNLETRIAARQREGQALMERNAVIEQEIQQAQQRAKQEVGQNNMKIAQYNGAIEELQDQINFLRKPLGLEPEKATLPGQEEEKDKDKVESITEAEPATV